MLAFNQLSKVSQQLFGSPHFLPIIIFLLAANLFLYIEDHFIRKQTSKLTTKLLFNPDNVANIQNENDRKDTSIIEIPEIRVSPLPSGYVPYPKVKCIYNFIRIPQEDLAEIKPPSATEYDQFSWRMIHRQYYKLKTKEIPFEIKPYFLLEMGNTDPILQQENKIFADLLFQGKLDYGSKIMSFIALEEDRYSKPYD